MALDVTDGPRRPGRGVGAGFDEGVDFVALLVAQEVEGRLAAAIGLGFEEFGNHPVFKEGAAWWMGGEMRRGADSEKPGGESGIAEVEFGSFDEALRGVGKPGANEEDEVAGLQHREPRVSGDPGDAGIRGQ